MKDSVLGADQLFGARRSVRAFLPEQVPPSLLEQIFQAALTAPSNCNTQPWQVYVASGNAVETLRARLPEHYTRGELSMDFPYDGGYQGVYKERQYAAAHALYDAMGIARDDKAERQASLLRNFSFFGAPHVAFVFLPEPFGLREAADVGMFAQNLMLSMTAHGIASCPQTALSFFADPVREVLNVESSNKLLMGISFGYEDTSAPVNQCKPGRGALSEFVHFVE